MTSQTSLYQRIGGEATFRLLVARFYAGVETDALLRPLYPEANLTGAAQRLSQFLIQYWGGPATYSELRGHPRLRMRHAGFSIGEAERDAWLHHMRTALDELHLPPADDAELWTYLQTAAEFLRNRAPVTAAEVGRPTL